MKSIIKNIVKYILIYVIAVIILFATLTLTTKIPKELIIDNLKESAEYYKGKAGIQRKSLSREYEALHYYADSMLLNIMYFTDSTNSAEAAMEAKFYKHRFFDSNGDFVDAIEKDKEANEQYIRYWHGSLSILRPLMLALNIEQIYTLTNITFWILFLALLIMLLKKYKTLAMFFIIASGMCTLHITPNCIEYIWTVLIMLIISIISLLIEKKGNKNLYVMYFISGIITCYLDFLSTETLTVLVPVLLVILVRYKEERIENLKDLFKFLVTSGALWFAGYSLMWFAKWILASVILNINALEYVKDNAMTRINWNSEKTITIKTYFETLIKNIIKIYPLNKVTDNKRLLAILVLIVEIGIVLKIISIAILKKKKEKISKEGYIKFILLLIALIPYLRYMVLLNHSYNHAFFTFRAQLPSLIAILFIIIYSIDKKIRQNIVLKLNKIVKKENKNNETNRIKHTNSST